ncbi:protein S40-5-like [Rhododendron vialii]|uniref:protein S40-5-like n=1 Tax=Rhododendron vialii TaxID=182163 RepID=UPI00265E8EF9|nr:protein S40-5-like [Rhododendron vialii]
MAKGRKLTISRSERYLGSHRHGHSGTISEAVEFEEDDVWSVVDGMVNGGGDDHSINHSGAEWIPRDTAENRGRIVRSHQYMARDDGSHVGGLSLAFDDDSGKTASPRILHQFRGHDNVASPRARNLATSAPVNVPDWSKIYRADSVESLHDSDDSAENFEMVPPHEHVARDYRRQTAANSVFEGMGRTLKGRDMSRVRDAVWSRTGFNG